MPTISQLVRKGRNKRKRIVNSKALKGHCQLRATVLRTMALDPKKPNSAKRHCCRVRLSNGIEVTAYIPGRGSNIQEHSMVLIKGGVVPDLPGVKYKVIRGARDCDGVDPEQGKIERTTSRSLYGKKRKIK